ncbi:Endoplasmic reticulum-Golgi intermediate compartment protein 2 [Chytridiales sp. JEL 0842]|nr:Endoplasmic reticulum-Golgi intermediate compartment protein 2 [Chytridiales sp. JEL 0842]
MSLLRNLHRFDAFTKLDRNIQYATGTGGALTLLVAITLMFLIYSELVQFWSIQHKYEFFVDGARVPDNALQINMDVTVAMNCSFIRADVLDVAGTSLPAGANLKLSETTFSAMNFSHRIDKLSYGLDHSNRIDFKHPLHGTSAIAQTRVYVTVGLFNNILLFVQRKLTK